MSRPKVSVIGAVRLSERQGVECSIEVGKGSQQHTVWVQVDLPNAERDCPGLGPAPEEPPESDKEARGERYAARNAYTRALHEHPNYKQAISKFIELPDSDPQQGPAEGMWIYRHKLCRIELGGQRDNATDALLIKHCVLRQERYYEKVRRQVEAPENMEKLEGVAREPIPESVRLFVWQRDKGQCVKCGSRERLEFDHIIPLAAGGGSSERNLQLLCEPCNRLRGSTI